MLKTRDYFATVLFLVPVNHFNMNWVRNFSYWFASIFSGILLKLLWCVFLWSWNSIGDERCLIVSNCGWTSLDKSGYNTISFIWYFIVQNIVVPCSDFFHKSFMSEEFVEKFCTNYEVHGIAWVSFISFKSFS